MSDLKDVRKESYVEGFVEDVRQMIIAQCTRKKMIEGLDADVHELATGKMLRTRFAARLCGASLYSCRNKTVETACVAAELVHTASLVHDDIIDGGLIRRSRPALWKTAGSNVAVLTGDLLYCEALSVLVRAGNCRHVKVFVDKVREVCSAEIEQELGLRMQRVGKDKCIGIARGKTGPLFAFLGRVCGNNNHRLCAALEESGYLAGTAYQLADDLMDTIGSEQCAGKTLGTDMLRKKFTLASEPSGQFTPVVDAIKETMQSAVAGLEKWPNYRNALLEFFIGDLQPVFDRSLPDVVLQPEIATVPV